MFNDIYSVRSLPISPIKLKHVQKSNHFDFESPSDNSRVRSRTRKSDWRKAVHPEIDDKYAKLLKGEKVYWQNQNTQNYAEPLKNESTNKFGSSQIERMKNDYEDKIKTLQAQNRNLREELYYLREALLINFQTKQKKETNK